MRIDRQIKLNRRPLAYFTILFFLTNFLHFSSSLASTFFEENQLVTMTFNNGLSEQTNIANVDHLSVGKKGDTEELAINFYFGVDNGVSSELRLQHTLHDSLPLIPGDFLKDHFINFNLHHNEGEEKSLFVAAKKGSVYKVIKQGLLAPHLLITSISFDLKTLCIEGDCTLNTYSGQGEIDTTQLLYIFPAPTGTYSVGSTVNLETYKSGLYFLTKFSSQFDPHNAPVVSAVQPGDGQLNLKFDKGNVTTLFTSVEKMYKTLTFNYGNTPSPSLSYSEAVLLDIDQNPTYHDPLLSGTLTIKDLPNNSNYNLAVGFVNKFNFVSAISPSEEGFPMEIEAFLKEQGCFLLSAGFQKRHYVLDYMRNFRDQVLLKNSWGKVFVNWYYQTAPQYAPIIYRNPLMAQLVRTSAYFLYFCLKYFSFLIFALMALSLLSLFKKRRFV